MKKMDNLEDIEDTSQIEGLIILFVPLLIVFDVSIVKSLNILSRCLIRLFSNRPKP